MTMSRYCGLRYINNRHFLRLLPYSLLSLVLQRKIYFAPASTVCNSPIGVV